MHLGCKEIAQVSDRMETRFCAESGPFGQQWNVTTFSFLWSKLMSKLWHRSEPWVLSSFPSLSYDRSDDTFLPILRSAVPPFSIDTIIELTSNTSKQTKGHRERYHRFVLDHYKLHSFIYSRRKLFPRISFGAIHRFEKKNSSLHQPGRTRPTELNPSEKFVSHIAKR